MTNEQEIRAWTLAIAELNNQGSFFKILGGEGSVVELTEDHQAYLKAIEDYIVKGTFRAVTYMEKPELKGFIRPDH